MKVSVEIDVHRPRQDGRCRVRITLYHKKLLRVPLDIHVRPSEWDRTLKRVRLSDVGSRALHSAYNRAIDKALERAQIAILERPGVTVEQVRDAIHGPDVRGLKLSDALGNVLQDHASQFKPSTIDRLGLIVRRVGEVLPDATLEGVSSSDVHRYREQVASEGLHQNTVRRHLRHLRLLYRRACMTHGIEPKGIFRGALPKELPSQRRRLYPDEVERLRSLDLPSGDLRLTRDAWMLAMCFGGMRFDDLKNLRPEEIERGWVRYRMGKTGDPKEIPVIPQARTILDAYAGGKTVLPLSGSGANTVANRRLKILAGLAGVNPQLSTHYARHSFAAWADSLGIERRVIQMILGHKTFSTTEVYLSGFDQKAVEQAMERFSEAMERQ